MGLLSFPLFSKVYSRFTLKHPPCPSQLSLNGSPELSSDLFRLLPSQENIYFIYVYVFHLCGSAYRAQKRVSNSLELELQVVVSHLALALVAELESPGRAINVLNC